MVRTGQHLRLAFDRASLSVPLAAAINACGGDRDRSVKLGAGSGGDSDESLRITRTRVRRRTSRCSGRSRRREIGVTSTDRSCGARAAERQGVRRATNPDGSSDLDESVRSREVHSRSANFGARIAALAKVRRRRAGEEDSQKSVSVAVEPAVAADVGLSTLGRSSTSRGRAALQMSSGRHAAPAVLLSTIT